MNAPVPPTPPVTPPPPPPLPLPLPQTLQADLTAAIRARDELVSSTLRLAITAVRSEEVAGPVKRELSEPEVLAVLGREVRKRREAAAAFDGGGRPDRAARERAEAAVLEAYLPRQLDDGQVDALVERVLDAAGLTGAQAMGAAMKAVQAELAATVGPGRVEGARVAAAVKRRLAG
jgi:uncharacterized protein YqeY